VNPEVVVGRLKLRCLAAALRLPARHALRRRALLHMEQAIAASGLFDTAYYLRRNGDLAGTPSSPLAHYVRWGDREGRQPHPLFQPDYYRLHAADPLAAVNSLLHYLWVGAALQRAPSPAFDSQHYLPQSPSPALPNLLQDYLLHGWLQGKSALPGFDAKAYLAANPDVAAAGHDPWLHWLEHGQQEGRLPNGHQAVDASTTSRLQGASRQPLGDGMTPPHPTPGAHAAGKGKDFPRAARMACSPNPLSGEQLAACERTLDEAFRALPPAEVLPLYMGLVHKGSRRYLSVLRAIQGALDAKQIEQAAQWAPMLEPVRDLSGSVALARLALQQQDKPRALEVLMQGGLQRVPPNLALAAVLLRLLADAGAPHDSLAKLLLAWRAGMPPDDWQQVLLRAASVFDTALLDAWLDLASALKHPGAEMWPVIRYFYREPQQALVHAQQARARFPGNPDLLMSLACAAILQQDHPLAESLCQEGLAASTLPAQRESFQFKLFELKCFAGDADQARSMLSEFSVEELSAVQKLATARFLAQQRDWARVADIMAGLLPELKTLEDSHLDLVLRAARATGTHDRFLAGLPEGIGAAALPPDRQRLLRSLHEDRLLAEHAATPTGLPATSTPMLDFKRDLLAPWAGAAEGTRRALYYCADAAYLWPALVSLHSLLSRNPGLCQADVHLLVADECLPLATQCAELLQDHHGVALRLWSASQVVSDAHSLKTEYGMFTGGHQLAVAAYYRIFLARALAQLGEYQQMVYIDADTLVESGFGDVFELPTPEGTLIAARMEVSSPEVRKAAGVHGMSADSYFNSGILLFPACGDALLQRLDRAIAIARTEADRLIYQDQCALNLAFQGCSAALPERFNFFAGPRDDVKLRATPLGEVALLHALDRPKPWEAGYPEDRLIQRRWLDTARSLHRLLGDAATAQLMRLTCAPVRLPQRSPATSAS